MEIKDVLTALDCLHKMIPFMKGISLHPDIEAYPKELEEKLGIVFQQADELVNPQEKELIFQFKELYSFNDSLLGKMQEELRLYNDKKYSPDGLTNWEELRFAFFNAVNSSMFNFSYNLQSYPWGSYLIYENLGVSNALFSPKENWPEKLDAIHVCLRTLLLEESGTVEDLSKTYGIRKHGLNTLAEYYGFSLSSLQNKNKEANEIIRTPPRDRSTKKVAQLNIVKNWLERDNYSKAANLVIM